MPTCRIGDVCSGVGTVDASGKSIATNLGSGFRRRSAPTADLARSKASYHTTVYCSHEEALFGLPAFVLIRRAPSDMHKADNAETGERPGAGLCKPLFASVCASQMFGIIGFSSINVPYAPSHYAPI